METNELERITHHLESAKDALYRYFNEAGRTADVLYVGSAYDHIEDAEKIIQAIEKREKTKENIKG